MSDAAREALEIQVNGELRALAAGSTIAALVEDLGLGDRRVAVAVNREVVPRSEFASRTLAAGDRVEILQAVGGGA
jgi:thiamine biosynthesis protein ThiS